MAYPSVPRTPGAKTAIRYKMRKFKEGRLTSHGRPVRKRSQALAMALNRARTVASKRR